MSFKQDLVHSAADRWTDSDMEKVTMLVMHATCVAKDDTICKTQAVIMLASTTKSL